MIFDIAIMNPPYDGNLHLQIIECIQHNVVKIVNISPIRWLEDPLARYKPKSDYNIFKDIISEKIESLNVIDTETANKIFGIDWYDLGISVIGEGGFDYNKFNNNDFVNKFVAKCSKTIMDISTEEGYKGEYTSNHFGIICSHYGDLNRWISDKYDLFTTKRETHCNKVIFFDSEIEVKNCFKYLTSKVMKCYAILARKNQRVPWQFVPALDFTRYWSEKDLCDYFGLNGYIDDNNAEPNSDWETILKTIKN